MIAIAEGIDLPIFHESAADRVLLYVPRNLTPVVSRSKHAFVIAALPEPFAPQPTIGDGRALPHRLHEWQERTVRHFSAHEELDVVRHEHRDT
jgi:hypothetical protein